MSEANEWRTLLQCRISEETETRVEIKGPIGNREFRRLVYLLQQIAKSYPDVSGLDKISTEAGATTMEEKKIGIERLTHRPLQ